MKKDFLMYEPSGVYEVPVTAAREQVNEITQDVKRLNSFVRINVVGRKDTYTVTVMLKDIRDVTWFKLKWI